MHPSGVLYAEGTQPRLLPVCDHYAGSEKLILKSLELQQRMGPVFDITADCEDGAAVGSEAAHAAMVAELVASAHNRFGRLGVRVHDTGHPHFGADLDIVVGAAGERVAFITVPKVACAAEVSRAIAAIDDAAQRHRLSRRIPVQVLIEGHGALRDVHAIAALTRVECLSFGTMDYVSGFGGAIPDSAMRSPEQFEHPLMVRAKAEIAVAAHEHGKVPAHGVCTDISGPEAAASDATTAARRFGYTRMWSIHPIQIPGIVAALTPDRGAIELAAAILLSASRAAWGPIRHDGRLHDRASYRYYWEVLRRAQAAGAALPHEAARTFFNQGA